MHDLELVILWVPCKTRAHPSSSPLTPAPNLYQTHNKILHTRLDSGPRWVASTKTCQTYIFSETKPHLAQPPTCTDVSKGIEASRGQNRVTFKPLGPYEPITEGLASHRYSGPRCPHTACASLPPGTGNIMCEPPAAGGAVAHEQSTCLP